MFQIAPKCYRRGQVQALRSERKQVEDTHLTNGQFLGSKFEEIKGDRLQLRNPYGIVNKEC